MTTIPAPRGAFTRGIRNNNPGNLRFRTQDKWQGLDPHDPEDREGIPAHVPGYCRFVSPIYGIRAIARQLIVYQDAHDLHTINDLIARWAPPTVVAPWDKNDTEKYIEAVVDQTGFVASQPYDMHRYGHLKPLVEAIITHENGAQPYSDAQIDEALRRAGVLPNTPKPTALQPGAAPAATITIGSMLSTAGGALKDGAAGSSKLLVVGVILISLGALFAYLSARKQRKLAS